MLVVDRACRVVSAIYPVVGNAQSNEVSPVGVGQFTGLHPKDAIIVGGTEIPLSCSRIDTDLLVSSTRRKPRLISKVAIVVRIKNDSPVVDVVLGRRVRRVAVPGYAERLVLNLSTRPRLFVQVLLSRTGVTP